MAIPAAYFDGATDPTQGAGLQRSNYPAFFSTNASGNVTGLLGPNGAYTTPGVALKTNANLNLIALVNNIIDWQVEDYDDLGAHSTLSNKSRITIPAGVARVRFSVSINTSAAPSDAVLIAILRKNGASYAQLWQRYFPSGTYGIGGNSTPLISTVPGDYWEINIITTATSDFHALVAGTSNNATFFVAEFF